MQYTIDWLEQKTTSTGKVKADATLMDTDGQRFEGVTIWGDFPGFAELLPGSSIAGEIVIKQNGNYTNKTIYPPRPVKQGGAGVAAAQQRKAEGINKTMDRKEDGIKISSTARMATDVLCAFYPQRLNADEAMKAKWQEWRQWFLENWDVDKKDLRQPF